MKDASSFLGVGEESVVAKDCCIDWDFIPFGNIAEKIGIIESVDIGLLCS